MKKFFIVFLAMLMLVFPLAGCSKDDGTIKINEVTHSIFYAPLYVAIQLGYFADAGLTIELSLKAVCVFGNGRWG